jgi:hypothetical protein
MNFEINYMEHIDPQEFDSNKNCASVSNEKKEPNTDPKEKESIYSKFDSPQPKSEKEEKKVKNNKKFNSYGMKK